MGIVEGVVLLAFREPGEHKLHLVKSWRSSAHWLCLVWIIINIVAGTARTCEALSHWTTLWALTGNCIVDKIAIITVHSGENKTTLCIRDRVLNFFKLYICDESTSLCDLSSSMTYHYITDLM